MSPVRSLLLATYMCMDMCVFYMAKLNSEYEFLGNANGGRKNIYICVTSSAKLTQIECIYIYTIPNEAQKKRHLPPLNSVWPSQCKYRSKYCLMERAKQNKRRKKMKTLTHTHRIVEGK